MNFLNSLTEIHIGDLSLAALFSTLILLLVCVIVIQILSRAINRALGKSKLEGSLKGFIVSAIKIVLWVLTIIILAERLGIPSASLIAALGVVGLAFSLSVQDLLTNLFSGLTILTAKPFTAGEFIEISDISGTVQSVDMFRTEIKTADNKVAFIPNSDIAKSKIINYSREELRRVDMIFCTSCSDDPERVRASILKVLSKDARIFVDPAPEVVLKSFDKGSVNYGLRVWVKNSDYWAVYFDLNEAVLEGFKKNGILMTYEHLNVHVLGETDHQQSESGI